MLPKGTSSRPGLWVTESYQREILNCIVDPDVRRIVCQKSTQVGWSEILNNCVGYYIDADPKPIMMVQPTETSAKNFSKKRISPMIENCPALKLKVREATSRRAGNTMQLKEFDGGFFKIAGANSGAGLRSDAVAVLLLDEVDAYPLDVDGEGDPIEIAEHRTESFDDAKVFIGSTPAQPKGFSRVEAEYDNSSQGLFYVPCPFCGMEQPLLWRRPDSHAYNLLYDLNDEGRAIPASVRYQCAGCKRGIDEKWKQRMLDAGRWVHQHEERRAVRGFRINALYSPWRPIWGDLADKWVKAQDNPEKLKSFINLSLGETWDEGGEAVAVPALAQRREQYAAAVPKGAAVLVASADVQHNRIEGQIMAFGAEEEAWLVAHEIFWGDPGVATEEENVWGQLDSWLLQPHQHESGAEMLPLVTLVDSGAHADSVYDFVLPRQHTRRIFASKGVDFLSKPGLAAHGTTKRSAIRLWTVATYAAKDRVLARLKIRKPGPGFIHLPSWVTEEYLNQITAEKKVPVLERRTRTRRMVYVKQYSRNEALDLTVYCFAALFILQNFGDAAFRDLRALAGAADRGHPAGMIAPARQRMIRSRGIE